MSVRILSNRLGDMACLYCSTSDWAFGPVFYDGDFADAKALAEDFLKWLGTDPRSLEDRELERKYYDWRKARLDDDGNLKDEPDGEYEFERALAKKG